MSTSERRRFLLLSLSAIADDPRVRKQGDALVAAGHDVVAVGFGGDRSGLPDWPIVTVAEPRLEGLRRGAMITRGVAARIGTGVATRAYWAAGVHRRALAAATGVGRVDVVVANDWRVLPVGTAVAARYGAQLHYDSHEYAVEERGDSWAWRALLRPFVAAIEGAHLRRANSVSTVTVGIAEAMESRYGLAETPTVIRNVPPYQELPFRPPGESMTILFHGSLLEDRGLKSLLHAVPLLDDRFIVVLRGPARERYRRTLQALVDELGTRDRVTIEPPVPMAELVRRANEADIGMFTPELVSEQLRLAGPNKIFEYVMAGLALVVSDAQEVRRIVDEHQVGIVVPAPTPVNIARALNALTIEEIADFKLRALRAAKTLCWEQEQQRFLASVGA